MTSRVPSRYQPLAIAGVALVVLLLVAGGVLLLGQLGPSSTPTPSSSPSPTNSPSADPSTPERATRAFFDAYSDARRTDDPSLVLPRTTGEESSAFRSAEAFLLGQKEVGKASITTVLEIENVSTSIDGNQATVTFDFTEGGYDISLDTGQPLESPQVLPTTQVTVELVLTEGRWLVDSYESRP